jgi:hypothetical protein
MAFIARVQWRPDALGLARAAGLPARDVYGIRAAKSEFG